MSNLTRRDFIKTASLVAVAMAVPVEVFAANETADLVVYGKIFTSENNRLAEAFAVKDGKFVYVGDKAGAKAFIKRGKTEVIDYTGKGLVMPACGNAHAHYLSAYAVQTIGTMIAYEDDVKKFVTEIVPAAVKKAKDSNATAIFGWDFLKFQDNLPVRQQLDAICDNIPVHFEDEEGHKALANTLALVKAGIMSKDGTVIKREVRGGEIVMGADGTPTGLLKEQAGTYTRSFLDNDKLFSVDIAKATMSEIEQHLLSEGYTMYLDGYSSYFFNDVYYRAAQQFDKSGNMHFILGLTYEFESWMDADEACNFAVDAQKYASAHVKTNWVKLFMDGTPESGTGVNRAVNAYINGGNREQALNALTINVAKQMFLENERGSIKAGKFADCYGDSQRETFGDILRGQKSFFNVRT